MHNALTGILTASSTVSATLQGNAIDTIGFQDMIAVLCVGTLKGSGATDEEFDVTVKFQEAATAASTGSDFADITSGALNGTGSVYGSAKFDVLAIAAGSVASQTPFKQRKLYCLLNQGGGKRYIRAHATIVGTLMAQCAVSVAALLGRPRESTYIIDAIANATSSADVQYGIAGASVPV